MLVSPTIRAARTCRPVSPSCQSSPPSAATPASASASIASICRVKGDVERTVYQNSTLIDGTIASNDDRNYDQYTGTLRGGYELTPGVKPFVEFGADTRVHDLNADISGYQRNSNGLTGKAGSTFELPATS